MSIELHCPRCQKLIRAPEKSGGKRGKCPYCSNSVYIPMAPDSSDEIGLAPIDETEERRADEEHRKASRQAAQLSQMKDAGPEADVSPGRTSVDPMADSLDVAAEVANYIQAMGASKLDEAESAASRLKSAGTVARDYINAQLVDELADIDGDIPAPVVKGFLKTLLGQIG